MITESVDIDIETEHEICGDTYRLSTIEIVDIRRGGAPDLVEAFARFSRIEDPETILSPRIAATDLFRFSVNAIASKKEKPAGVPLLERLGLNFRNKKTVLSEPSIQDIFNDLNAHKQTAPLMTLLRNALSTYTDGGKSIKDLAL